MDSTTLLYDLRNQGHECRCIVFDYGQRHRVELPHACNIARDLGVRYVCMDLRSLAAILPGNALTDLAKDLPQGNFADGSMKANIVPNRNMILLSIAIGHAIAHKCDAVSYAAQTGEAVAGESIYYDCRPAFVNAMRHAASICDEHGVDLVVPYRHLTKANIIHIGTRLGVPYEKTYSCYAGGEKHCGICGACTKRQLGFFAAGVKDPTVYIDSTFVPKPTTT